MAIKNIYVIGHRNPDTDSVVSAAAYAHLKRAQRGNIHNDIIKGGSAEQEQEIYHAARAGKINPQTEYIFNRFKVPVPQYLPDLIPKVGYYGDNVCECVDEMTPLWNAVTKMEEKHLTVLPVIDAQRSYVSLLHYNGFARNILKILNPERETTMSTSIMLMINTLNAQALVLKNENDLFKCSILVAAAQFDTFTELLHIHAPANTVVITGDRKDIQEYCIECGVRALVISTGAVIEKELREKAEKNNVSVLISPYDTSATSLLIVYSTPVSTMADAYIKPVRPTDTVRKIRPLLAQSPSRCLPVVDDENHILGIISESDLIEEPNISLILVDHNEIAQAVEGAEHYKIREVIDHHRLGNFTTRYPITFINKPVGATATIVTNLFRENRIPIPKDIASILLSGILSDTLVLQSSTTTDIDCETAEYLSNITNLNISELGSDIISAASNITGRTAGDVIRQDMKDYSESGFSFTVSQIEVDNVFELIKRKDEFISELEIERRTAKCLFCALMVTDTTQLTSLLLIASDKSFIQFISLPTQEDSIYILKDVVSRKKQLIPLLSELIEKMAMN